jgi:hypothetical protein
MSETGTEHRDIVAREADGELVIGIDRAFARRFFTDTPIRVVHENTGESPYFAKGIVMAAFLGSPLTLVVASALAIATVRWWAILVIPIGILAWILHGSASSLGRAGLTPTTLLLSGLVVAWLLNIGGYDTLWRLGSAYGVALWLDRFLYVAATILLRALVIRNARAFRWLQSHLILRAS